MSFLQCSARRIAGFNKRIDPDRVLDFIFNQTAVTIDGYSGCQVECRYPACLEFGARCDGAGLLPQIGSHQRVEKRFDVVVDR